MASNKALSEKLRKVDDELKKVSEQLKDLRIRRTRLLEEKQQLEAALVQKQDEVDEDHWEKGEFSWTTRAREVLKSSFHLSSFRHLQLSAINAVMAGEDALLIMSTGGGKSLCYQLPALLQEGISLVVSPLVSLMEDQVLGLERLMGEGIAAKLSQATTKEKLAAIQNDMINPNGKLRILYVTPEKLAKSKRFMAKLEKTYEAGRLKLIAIDEVHCCSQWGHDFRPDYKFLNVLRRQFAKTPILGLTATATASVLEDVKEMLGIPGALVFRAGFNRPNLFYEIRQKPPKQEDVLEDMTRVIEQEFSGESGIVYCFSRKESEEVAAALASKGVRARCYHADMEPATRSRVHEYWVSRKCQVIVATVAFGNSSISGETAGMGIDKPDVRFVIHHSMPKSMENYYQESGRAGRDGQPAKCILYFRIGDVFRQSTMVCTEKTGLEKLYPMLSYCVSVGKCRRMMIADSFMEDWETSWCQNGCDVCVEKRESKKVKMTEFAKELVAKARNGIEKQQKLTGLKLMELFLKNHKKDSSLDRTVGEALLGHLLLEQYLKEDFHFTPYSIISYIVPGPKADLLQDRQHSIDLLIRGKATKRKIEAEPASSKSTKLSASQSMEDDDDDVVALT